MSTPQELILRRYQLFPSFDEAPLEEQRDKIRQLFAESHLLDACVDNYQTNDVAADIERLRYDGLTGYVDSVSARMRQGDIIDIASSSDVIATEDIFASIENRDGQNRPALFIRRIGQSRVAMAKLNGSDRDRSSKLDYHDGFNEAQAIKEYAITDPSDLTYVSEIIPNQTSPIMIAERGAILVYAVEALQPLSPYKVNKYGSIGLAAFVDKRLKQPSLLAVVQSQE